MSEHLRLLKKPVTHLWQASDSELWYSCLLATIFTRIHSCVMNESNVEHVSSFQAIVSWKNSQKRAYSKCLCLTVLLTSLLWPDDWKRELVYFVIGKFYKLALPKFHAQEAFFSCSRRTEKPMQVFEIWLLLQHFHQKNQLKRI